MKYNYVAIEGAIGAGKTTLAQRLADELGRQLILEEFSDNSFLAKFYESPERYAFPLEVSFLVERFQQLETVLPQADLFNTGFVSDYLFDKSWVFAQMNLKDDHLKLFRTLFYNFQRQLPKPDLILYLYNTVPHLQQNIRKRGRSFESSIQDEYLVNLQQSYLSYFKQVRHIPVVVLDVTDLDFVEREEDYEKIKEVVSSYFPAGIIPVQI